MKIDSMQIHEQAGPNMKPRTGAFTDSLKDGDKIKAEVLSSEKGAVVMKTGEGHVFKARLDTDAVLAQGDKVLLEYAGKEGRLVFLSFMGEEPAAAGGSGQSALVRDFDDKSLEPYANKLAELRMSFTEDTARAMREILVSNPGLTLEEAAFLASNKLAGDDGLVKAALALLSDGPKTDELLERLLTLLISPEETALGKEQPASPDALQAAPEQNHQLPAADSQPLTRELEAPLTDWLKQLGEGAEGALKTPAQEAFTDVKNVAHDIISQSDSVLQSRNVLNNAENNVENQQSGAVIIENTDSAPQKQINIQPETPQTITPETASAPALQTPNPGEPAPAAAIRAQTPEQVPNRSEAVAQPDIQAPNQHGALSKAVAQMLSEIPEFRGTPLPALERFSNMLLKVAGDTQDSPGGNTEKLAALIDKLFTRVEKSDEGAGERLRSAREELFARMTLIEEAASRAELPSRTEMLTQTRSLVDHVRLLNSIDQFVYVQLPVKMGEESKTAELYIFKKKNGKRVDPENANILLALDLENMGHWEGLINIRNKDVSIRMEVRGEAEKEFFSEKTVMLHELLAEAGFRLVNTDITNAKEETTPLTALCALDRHISGRPGGIDYIV